MRLGVVLSRQRQLAHGVEAHRDHPLLPSAQELLDSSGGTRRDQAGTA